ncbi:hypothetical protein JD844_031255 [Phrynosoma platyrhinos]|uniref:Interleukin-1 n=1 Tax=Phrynosoma platyrhinos TaxID=52577 RepID=A0ABQ7T1P4_PHRPL|nr:hypothetical protein JD844_031255 [Phrynosoma platyrhinos]
MKPAIEKIQPAPAEPKEIKKPQKMTWNQEVAPLFPVKKSEPEPELEGLDIPPLKIATIKKPWLYRFWDVSQKFLFLVDNKLVANPRDSNAPEHLIAVLPNTVLDPKKQAVFMGLSDEIHTFSCVKSGEGKPQLQIVGRSIMELYRKKEELKSFSFYSKTDGSPETCSFESAEFPVPNPKETISTPLREKVPRLYRIWDISQKFLFLVNNIIVANARTSNAPEVFMEVLPNTALDPKMQPIFMGPNGRKHSLSCVKAGEGEPQLQLVETDIKKLYNTNEHSLSFTFYSKTDGSPETCSFESAEFPELFMEVFPNAAIDPKMQPIFMGPQGRKHSLSCVKSGEGQPQLQLVETDITKLYEKREKLFTFTFYSKTDGSPETCSFESAEFPGWFISTSLEPNKPVRLSRQGGAENTLFYFERK